jgi:hypothetical protein
MNRYTVKKSDGTALVVIRVETPIFQIFSKSTAYLEIPESIVENLINIENRREIRSLFYVSPIDGKYLVPISQIAEFTN